MSPVSGEESSATQSNLNANASEFIPIMINEESTQLATTNSIHSTTGAIPKKFYKSNNNYRRDKFDRNQRWRSNNGSSSQRRETFAERNNRNENANFEPLESNNQNKKFFANNKPPKQNDRMNDQNQYEGSSQTIQRQNISRQIKNAQMSNNNRLKNNNRYGENEVLSERQYYNRRNNNYGRNYNGIRSNNENQKKEVEQNQQEEVNEKPTTKNRPKKREPFNRKKDESKASSASQRDRLIKEIESNTLECMICCEKIKSYQPIWSCSNCYHILHLYCIKTWMKNSKNDEGEWRCPACNQMTNQKPGDYLCFCGKLKNPAVNRNDLAHSCGEMCMNQTLCPHPCQLKCHPGPHEICYASVLKTCGCGKTSKTYQCSMKAAFECELICDKKLNCSLHKCTKICHQGPCNECTEQIECSCFCGAEKKILPCIVDNLDRVKYSCEKECGKLLSCGNHTCKQKCHEDDCGKCKLLPEFVLCCPCTRTPVKEGSRTSCIDPIPICENICKKALRCGKLSSPHLCQAKCHLNECPPCNQTSNVKCRCGRKEEKIPCKELTNSDLRCKKKCNKFKSCGRHKCRFDCCIDPIHKCTLTCNRLLNCKLHKCQRICHIDNCAPCYRVSFDELRCECGFTVIYPPVPCNTKISDCPKKCTRTHKCNHQVIHNCHSESECPPCVFLTSKFCYGKHEERKTIPCNQESFCCGMPCGKLLKCGRHTCIKTCHQGECEKKDDFCKQKCTMKRFECDHNCNAQCHEGKCPDNISCREKVQVSCVCGNLKEFKTCEQVEYENKKLQRIHITMQMQEMQQSDGITDLKTMLGDFKKTTKILECNDECKTLERNRRLDIAFKVQNPTLASTPRFVPTYSDHVRNYYKKDPTFVNMVHDKLTELVKLAKESKAPYRCHSFPSMNRDKRHVIHDMAELFGIETQAYDAEPNRNIVATATREYCWLPSMSMAEIASRENGARRPPSNQTFK
ncbi:hypothetical protein PVAND_004471 [Polypedilum vanderplanki]|uniref:Transcriptional repressor NF-X1-like protein n=1 Tax=Polypedilum vanderplanki TaxID=319348 RepID=A0A9J6BY89_POLVA|nr:hypothetical protein PVAND_004471 [Polypedilum vanderplanki]